MYKPNGPTSIPAVDRINRFNVLPYEYDDYYKTRVNRAWSSRYYPIPVGIMLIVIGALTIIWSAIDIAQGASKNPYLFNPNYISQGVMPSQETGKLAADWHENSIWPTLGKGFWVGFLIVATGVLAIISRQDGSFISLFSFLLLAWTSAILALYLMLSAILSVQVYPFNRVFSRGYAQNIELGMNILIICMGVFSFILSLIGALMSCVYLGYCTNGRRTLMYSIKKSKPKYSWYSVAPSNIPVMPLS